MIRVVAPGPLTSVQDLGRPGHGPLGVAAGGAADPLAVRLGNLLLGNPEGAAVLEATLLGPTLRFDRPAEVALAGATTDASLDGAPVPAWTVLRVRAGATLAVGRCRNGARAYLCVRGGIDVPEVLGSRSTDLGGRFGGLEGRALEAGDALPAGLAAGPCRGSAADPAAAGWRGAWGILRVTPGPQAGWFGDDARGAFAASSWSVAESSDRRGLRLEGPRLGVPERQLLTEGVALGAVQVPAEGRPIVLGVDQQTTGGYPKIAAVIAADLPLLGQLRPRDAVRFREVSWDDARAALVRREARLLSPRVFVP